MRRFVRICTSVALSGAVLLPVLSGCGQGDTSLGEAISTLAASGVATYDSYAATAPIEQPQGERSAMKLTRWQLHNLVAAARAGMGMPGLDLDRIGAAQAPKGAPGFSSFVAAWLKRGSSPLARYAAQFMPKNADYAHAPRLLYPLLALTLFIADAARIRGVAAERPKTDFAFERLIAAPAQAAGICSTVNSFIDDVITTVVSALKVSGDGFFATLWNTVVVVVVNAGIGALKLALAPLFKLIATIAGVISLVAMVASTLQPWTLSVHEDPEKVMLSDQPVEGKLTAVLDAPTLPWPSDVIDCASTLGGIDLNNVTYKDAPVTWEPNGEIPAHAGVVDAQSKIGDDKRATLTYRTIPVTDMPKPECSTEQYIGGIGARATVERSDVLKLEQELTKAIINQLPQVLATHLLPFFQPWINSAQRNLQNALSSPVTAYGYAQLSELQLDSLKCTPAPIPSGPAAPTPLPQPTDANSTALVGSWKCEIDQTVQTPIGPIAVKVNTSLVFDATTASGSTPRSAAWAGDVHHVKTTNELFDGSYPYTYKSDGASGGTLEVKGNTYPVTMKGTHAFSMPVTSSISHKTYQLGCVR